MFDFFTWLRWGTFLDANASKTEVVLIRRGRTDFVLRFRWLGPPPEAPKQGWLRMRSSHHGWNFQWRGEIPGNAPLDVRLDPAILPRALTTAVEPLPDPISPYPTQWLCIVGSPRSLRFPSTWSASDNSSFARMAPAMVLNQFLGRTGFAVAYVAVLGVAVSAGVSRFL